MRGRETAVTEPSRTPVRRQGKAVTASLVSGLLLTVGTAMLAGTTAYGSTLSPGASAPSAGQPPREGTVRSVDLPSPPTGTASTHLRQEHVSHFSLIGVTWDDATDLVDGRVRVRARNTDSGQWTAWTDLSSEHGEDSGTTRRRGGTEPVWVGDSDGVEVGVDGGTAGSLPTGMRLDLVGPAQEPSAGALAAGRAPLAARSAASLTTTTVAQPDITPRSGWEADESLREQTEPNYSPQAPKVVFVHHTATTSNYSCTESPAIIRSMYAYHVTGQGWRDLGYNFIVDRCGTIFEGRYGGIDRGVVGAQTYGFNTGSTGVTVIGTYTDEQPSQEARRAVAHLAAWKLGLAGTSPTGTAQLVEGAADSAGFVKGRSYTFQTISGHRDGYATECPGQAFYDKLPEIRTWAAELTNGS
ncbi:MAG: hypothetical protein QG608_2417 [Actinomycetota bacterium]|nr:hypothetical protein [Actinomycetota bacterium]